VAFRDGPLENLKTPLTWLAGIVAVGIIAVAIVLLVADRRGPDTPGGHGGARQGFDAVAGPINGIFAWPVRKAGDLSDYVGDYFFAVSENRKLKQQVRELEPWRDQAIALKNVNARYEAMLGLRTEPPVELRTARSISESRGPFARARLLDVGTNQGVSVGNPVINEHGLVGRVVGTSGGISRMLLVSDVSSRIPVLIDRTDARAILTGDGSGNPRLAFVRGHESIRSGDRILTSGDGGGLPRGLPIGVAARGIDGTWRVKLFSDRGAIDYVRIMLYRDFGYSIGSNDLNAPPLASLGPAPAAPANPTAAGSASAPSRPAATGGG
jgi:Cell shape-determining protein